MSKQEQRKLPTNLELTESIVSTLWRLIDEERRSRGDEFADNLALSVLASLNLNIVTRSLKAPALSGRDLSDDELELETERSFQIMRSSIEDAIAKGFTRALREFSGNDDSPEYVCEVEPEAAPHAIQSH